MIYLYNNQEELIRVVPSDSVYTAYHTQSLTDEHYVSELLEAELIELDDTFLDQVEYISIPNMDDKYKHHLFFVTRTSTESGATTFFGTQSGVEELRKTPVKDIRPQNQPAATVVRRLLEGTNWQMGYMADVPTASTNFYYTNVFEALKTVCQVWGLEMQFFVEINGNQVGARYIEFRKKLGTHSGERVVYGHNALKIIQESEKVELYTALIGRGKALEVSSAQDNASGQAGYGRKLTFADIEWRANNGKPVDKPKGQEYVELKSATAKYGIKSANGNRPKVGVVEFEIDDAELLLQRTYERLLEVSRPSMTFKTSTAYLKGARIGNTVRVIDTNRHLDYETRVFEIKWNRIDNSSTDVKLGDQTNVSEGAKTLQLKQELENKMTGGIIQRVINYLPSADGKNTNWYTDFDPISKAETKGKVRIGDTWYQPDPTDESETIVKVWTGELWKELYRTKGWTDVEREQAELKKRAKALEVQLETVEGAKLPEMVKRIEALDDQAKLSVGIIGNDKEQIYSANRIPVEIDTSQDVLVRFEDGKLTFTHNGSGFTPGQPYTLAGINRFVERPYSKLSIIGTGGMTVTAKPDNAKYPTRGGSGAYVSIPKAYHDKYTVTAVAPGLVPRVYQVQVDKPIVVQVNQTAPVAHELVEVDGPINKITHTGQDAVAYCLLPSIETTIKLGDW